MLSLHNKPLNLPGLIKRFKPNPVFSIYLLQLQTNQISLAGILIIPKMRCFFRYNHSILVEHDHNKLLKLHYLLFITAILNILFIIQISQLALRLQITTFFSQRLKITSRADNRLNKTEIHNISYEIVKVFPYSFVTGVREIYNTAVRTA
jgi:hypothetical protein